MRFLVVTVALIACQPPADGARRAPGTGDPVVTPTTEVVPTCDPTRTVDALHLDAVTFPQNALGRALTVDLASEAGAIVTCALDAAPPRWRQLVPISATWRWIEAGDPGPGFSDPSFDDSAWPSGPAPFAHEDPGATELAPGAADPPPLVWLRTTFEVDDPAAVRALTADLRRDDGEVVWLNGVEVVRDNVPPVLAVTGDDERMLHPYDLDPALLVAGTNTLAVELCQFDGSSDAGFALRLAAEVDQLLPEVHVLRSDSQATHHELSLFGLLADASYTCEARADTCGGATVSTVVRTDPLPVPIRLAAPPGLDDPSSGYVLFNHSRPCAEDRTNRLFVTDPEGRIRWYRELPIEATSSIDIESALLPDGTILWGGGEEPEGVPQIVGLDGETVYTPSYPGVEDDLYHHDLERLPDGRLIGLVESEAGDGVASWNGFALVEHDPATGEVTWRWESQDAFERGELPPALPDQSDPWHPNSLAVVDDADGPAVYLSLYETMEIVRIDRATGEITWHLGLGRDFTLTGGGSWFDRLHAIDVFPGPTGDRLFLYDNGHTTDQSRAMALSLDPASRQATIDWEWTEPTWYEPNWGDADLTERGTVLVTMSHAWCFHASPEHLGAFVEVDEATGDVVSRIDLLDADDSTYRGQRIDGCALFANRRYCPEGSAR